MDTPTHNEAFRKGRKLLFICYILYLLWALLGLTGFVAVVINYVKRRELAADPVLASHVSWQIKTFWQVFVGWLACSALMAMGIALGLLLLPLVALWMYYRTIRGVMALLNDKAAP